MKQLNIFGGVDDLEYDEESDKFIIMKSKIIQELNDSVKKDLWGQYSNKSKIYKGCHTFEDYVKEVLLKRKRNGY